MDYRYTAALYYGEEQLSEVAGNDARALWLQLLHQIEESQVSTYGLVVDQQNQQVLHRCRKAAID
jgi:hypothetical protein